MEFLCRGGLSVEALTVRVVERDEAADVPVAGWNGQSGERDHGRRWQGGTPASPGKAAGVAGVRAFPVEPEAPGALPAALIEVLVTARDRRTGTAIALEAFVGEELSRAFRPPALKAALRSEPWPCIAT